MNIILFKTEHCVKCKSLKMVIEPICKKNNVDFTEVLIDKDPNYIGKFNLTSVPTLIIMNGNEEKARWINYVSGIEFQKKLDELK